MEWDAERDREWLRKSHGNVRFRFSLANNHITDGIITSPQQEVMRGEVIVRGFVNPTVVVSTYIEFDHCRWNSGIVVSHIVNQLMELDPLGMDRGRDLWT